MVVRLFGCALGCTVTAVLGCGAPEPPEPTGGVDVDATRCGRGLVVVSTDYQSTNVSLTDRDGQVLSSSFISSASATTGLSAPLGGDVVAPTTVTSGDQLVLIDRFPAAVVTWVDVGSGEVTAQLSVATGFASNPQDYLELSPRRALVSRFEQNPDPGREAFDEGGDLLVVDPSGPTITDRVGLSGVLDGLDAELLPRPGRMVATAERVFVLLSVYSASFAPGPSQLVALSREDLSVESVVELGGLEGCVGLALSPDETRIAVSCSGGFDGATEPDLERSGFAVVSVDDGLEVTDVVPAAGLTGRPSAYSVAFAADDVLLVPTFGQLDGTGETESRDELIAWNATTRQHVELAAGEAFTFGEVRCPGDCGDCFMTDAEGRGALRQFRFNPESGTLEDGVRLGLESEIDLPPRYLGGY